MTIKELNDMTDDQLRIKLAELLGWRMVEGLLAFPPMTWLKRRIPPDVLKTIAAVDYTLVPEFPTDLNACHEEENALTDDQTNTYRLRLLDLYSRKFHASKQLVSDAVSAKPRQRTIALILTLQPAEKS